MRRQVWYSGDRTLMGHWSILPPHSTPFHHHHHLHSRHSNCHHHHLYALLMATSPSSTFISTISITTTFFPTAIVSPLPLYPFHHLHPILPSHRSHLLGTIFSPAAPSVICPTTFVISISPTMALSTHYLCLISSAFLIAMVSLAPNSIMVNTDAMFLYEKISSIAGGLVVVLLSL